MAYLMSHLSIFYLCNTTAIPEGHSGHVPKLTYFTWDFLRGTAFKNCSCLAPHKTQFQTTPSRFQRRCFIRLNLI